MQQYSQLTTQNLDRPVCVLKSGKNGGYGPARREVVVGTKERGTGEGLGLTSAVKEKGKPKREVHPDVLMEWQQALPIEATSLSSPGTTLSISFLVRFSVSRSRYV